MPPWRGLCSYLDFPIVIHVSSLQNKFSYDTFKHLSTNKHESIVGGSQISHVAVSIFRE